MWFQATVLALLLALTITAAAPITVIDTDFGQCTVPVNDVSADGAKRLTGSIPAGWTENSGWNKEIVVSYEPREEAGRKFLRVTKTSGGNDQLAYYLEGGIPQETFFHVELTARSSGKAGVTVGIRDAGPPYSFHWSIQPALALQWQTLTYDFRLDRKPQRVGAWINLGGNGSYDLAHFKLVTRTREDIIAELKDKYPESAARNLVRVSRFPLGLPTGWSLDRDCSDGDQVVTGPDATVTGPSGAPSLSVKSAEAWRLWTAPVFIGRSFEAHTASLYARGTGKLRLTAFGDGRQLQSAERELKPDAWERVTLTFSPVLLGQMHQLTINGEGNVWLDAFQVERGSAATDYAPQQVCEVALGLPESAASAACVQFSDEPAAFRYAVTGAPAGSVLKLKQCDLYGGETALPDVKSPVAGSLKLALPAARPLGTFRVEAHVEDARGQTISPPDEVVLHRVRRPRYWEKPAPNSPFGIHTNSTTRHILMAKAIGANWTRLHDAGTQYIGWAHLEPEPGQWTFHDTELRRFGRHGLKILGLLSTAPLWATYQDKPRSSYFDRYVEPKDFGQFGAYVKVVTQRYAGLIDSYDVWNEPWGTGFWSMGWDFDKNEFKRSPTASEDYAKLQQMAFASAKAVDRKLTILGFNTYGSQGGRDWTADLLKFGALPACDAFCYHHYSSAYNGYPGDDVEKALKYATEPIVQAQGRVPKPVWMTEGSPTTYQLNNGFYHFTEPGQATDDNWEIGNRLCRYMVSLLSHKVAKFFLYKMHGHGPYKPAVWEWTVLVEDNGALHPSGVAHAHCAWLLEDTQYVKVVEPAEGVFAYLFAGNDRALAVLSSKPEHAPYAVPKAEGVTATDLFGNDVKAGEKVGDNLVYLSADRISRLEGAVGRGR
jgi:hypothetical protein